MEGAVSACGCDAGAAGNERVDGFQPSEEKNQDGDFEIHHRLACSGAREKGGSE